MSIDLKALERQLYADGYRLALQSVGDGYSVDNLRAAVVNMHRLVDELVDSFTAFAAKENHAPDCRKRCSWCCWQPVFALSYELDNLNAYLKENYSDEVLEQISIRAEAKRKKLKGLSGVTLLSSRVPCPLLSNRECMAYNARPVACRIYLSANVSTCRKFFDHPNDPDAIPALLNLPLRAGRYLNEGFRAGLKAGGITIEEMRIEEGLTNL